MKQRRFTFRVPAITLSTLLVFSLGSTLTAIESFGSDFSQDYPLQNSRDALTKMPKQTAPLPPAGPTETSAPAPDEPGWTPIVSTSPTPPLSTTEVETTKVTIPTPAQMPTLASPYNIQKPKISVPSYEAKYRNLLAQEANTKLAKKKKTFWASLREEANKYGLLFVLFFVISIIIFTLYKDRETIRRAEDYEKLHHPEDEKKDIWDEGF